MKNFQLSEDQITIHSVLADFDEEYIQAAKKRIMKAAGFIIVNSETKQEKNIANRLAKIFRKKTIIITDTYLMNKEKTRAYFIGRHPAKNSPSNGRPCIYLGISALLKNKDSILINDLFHEAYHAWRYYTSNTKYSVIDEARAWNISLQFSNKFRMMHGIPIERENEYSANELIKIDEIYNKTDNISLRYGGAENIFEKIGYGIANSLLDIADKIDSWTYKVMFYQPK